MTLLLRDKPPKSKKEVPVEVMPDGSLRKLSQKEVRAWCKRIKTRLRDKPGRE